MDKTEFLNKITEIGTCDDDVQRRELLSQLQEGVSSDYDRFAEMETSNATLKTDNDKLRDYNMKLFLRVGEQKSQSQIDKENGIDNPPEKRDFKNLFNEKGEIK